MKGLGSGDNGELTFLDAISIVSFCIGLQNLGINLTQDDLSKEADRLLNEVHSHLESQDQKLDLILKRLEAKPNDG